MPGRFRLRRFAWPRGVTAAGLLGLCLLRPVAAVEGRVGEYAAPGGGMERCVALARVPGGVYAPQDHDVEERLCGMDFHAPTTGLCPKVFSTSPGVLVYDLAGGAFAGRPGDFEAEHCASRGLRKPETRGDPISFKLSVNGRETSATFSTASLLYYHFSRYFDAAVHVPVAVWRSMDREIHLERIVEPGLRASAGSRALRMNHAGWELLRRAEVDPASFSPADELFTADRRQVYGVLLRPDGRRYGPELNGTRESGWGAGQSRDFQETAAYLALRIDAPLAEAIEAGLAAARGDATLREALGEDVSALQLAFWMQELTEITLLDFIFSQQDRVGNIDYVSFWYWVEDGEVRRRPADGSAVPADLAPFDPLLIRRSQLNDNDAGGRVPYANYAKTTGMLENLHHYGADSYRRLQRLAADFRREGERYGYLRETFGLSGAQFRQAVNNTLLAADLIAASCRAGALRFDLDPEALLRDGAIEEQRLACDAP